MGLSASSEPKLMQPAASKPADLLSSLETQNLHAFYARIAEKAATVKDAFRSDFIAKVIETNGFMQKFDKLHELAVRTTKSSTKKTMEYVWEMLQLYQKGDQQHSLLYYFILFVVELVTINDGVDKIDDESQHLFVEKYKQYILDYLSIDENDIKLENLMVFVNNYAVFVPKVIETFLGNILFGEIERPSFTPFRSPMLLDESCILSNSLDLTPLALYSTHLQGKFKRLYTSRTDGYDFNRIYHHIQGYSGPTMLLIKTRNTVNHGVNIFGAFSTSRWKDSNKFYGDGGNFLFTLYPTLRIYRSTSSSTNYQYLNIRSYNLKHGLAFGGTEQSFRLFIPDSLERCEARPYDIVYEKGALIANNKVDEDNVYFDIDNIEFWCCGADDVIKKGLQGQVADRANRDELIRKAQSCDKAAFFNNDFDKEFLLGNTMAHRNEVQKDRL